MRDDKTIAGSKPPGLGFAGVFGGAGLVMMVLMAVSPEGLHVPLWVAEAAAASFVFAGIAIAGQATGKVWLTRAGGLGTIYGLCVPGLWIMLDPAEKSCSAGFMFFTSSAGDLSCRIAFGAGAVVTVLCAIAMTIAMIRKSAD